MKLSREKLNVLIKITFNFTLCFLISNVSFGTSINAKPALPKGLSEAWYDFVNVRKSKMKYSSIYESAKIKSTPFEKELTAEVCEEQKKFNHCDLWWCLAWIKENHSKKTNKIIEAALQRRCDDLQIRNELKTRVDSLSAGRNLCLSEYNRSRRIGVIGYTCEGLLD